MGCYIHQQLYRSDPWLLPLAPGNSHSMQFRFRACMHVYGVLQRCVNAAVHTCMSHLLQGRACPHVVCNQRLHRRLSLYTVVQAAVNRLERETAYAFSQEMVKSRLLSQFFLGWPAWRCNRHLYTVHEVPHVMWRHTRSSSDGSESAPEVWSDLTDAALVLLENPTLAGVIRPQQQQQQQQHHTEVRLMVPSRQRPKYGPSAAGNWESFVQECLAPKSGAATAALVSRQEVSASSLAAL